MNDHEMINGIRQQMRWVIATIMITRALSMTSYGKMVQPDRYRDCTTDKHTADRIVELAAGNRKEFSSSVARQIVRSTLDWAQETLRLSEEAAA